MKQQWPAPERNKRPILAALRRWLPSSGTVLEISSGSGQHAVHFARELPGIRWQPSDMDPDHLASVAAWREQSDLPNLLTPLELDVLVEPWPLQHADAIFCANMIHIAPEPCTEALLRGAARLLPGGGRLVLYGPFRIGGEHHAESNARFDESLRARDPRWGVRDVEAVTELASGLGLVRLALERLPANNHVVVFERYCDTTSSAISRPTKKG